LLLRKFKVILSTIWLIIYSSNKTIRSIWIIISWILNRFNIKLIRRIRSFNNWILMILWLFWKEKYQSAKYLLKKIKSIAIYSAKKITMIVSKNNWFVSQNAWLQLFLILYIKPSLKTLIFLKRKICQTLSVQ
jgi:hypothetical protein